MSKSIIYPGTFDPLTYGHIDLISRASDLFSTVIVAVAENSQKAPLFSLSERVHFIKNSLGERSNIVVEGFSGLLVDFANEKNIKLILRGLRTTGDFEYELQLAGMNRRLDEKMETLFITPSESCAFISSSLVREIAVLGGDVSSFVPPIVQTALVALMRKS